jgi:hypothetical protein
LHSIFHAVIASALAVFAHVGPAQADCANAPRSSAVPTIAITPVTLRVMQDAVYPVSATDGYTHIAYAAEIINARPEPVEIDSVTPVDATKDFAPTGKNQPLDTANNAIAGKVRLFGPSSDGKPGQFTTRLPGGAAGTMFFDVVYADGVPLPALLAHKLVVTDTKTGEKIEGVTNPLQVRCELPVVLHPPLKGHGWWDSNGCCQIVNAHRSATLPTNGDFKSPEQFAIDYVQIDANGGCCTGPLKDVTSWPYFGAPVLAAAPGKVVEVSDGMPEQIPGPPVGVTAANAPGNHIIEDIGKGHFVLYAHLKTGSIPTNIKPGTMLTAGQEIGLIGNTGSSTAPHLHFQVMDRPSALNSVGLPFVFDSQVVEGKVEQLPAEADDIYEGGKALTVEKVAPATMHNRMPAETQVFGYNLK